LGVRVQIADVNILIYAHREDAENHDRLAAWLREHAAGPAPFGVSELVLSGFVRIVTNPRVFRVPTPTAIALAFCRALLDHPLARRLRPGPGHFQLFEELCRVTSARGKLVADAYHAALALEHGCDWITTDGDFQQFPGLRTSHPFSA
jgi:hypothetical protein